MTQRTLVKNLRNRLSRALLHTRLANANRKPTTYSKTGKEIKSKPDAAVPEDVRILKIFRMSLPKVNPVNVC